MEYLRKSDALDLLDKALVRSVESGGGHEASGLVTAKCQIAAVPAVDVMPKSEHESALKECENGYAATLHLERSRIANQREEINRLLKHARDVEKSRMYWKDKALRIGKQLHDILYGEERTMIVKIAHVRSADSTSFADAVRRAVSQMQAEDGLDVEVQYVATPTTDETPYIVYSALVIGREYRKEKV